ncbi:Uncharacterised protein [uncultured archaeon]|nr:Uncharacterised protein [uncultured archaeon]
MKTTLALAALICLMGPALAQTMFTGEGYSSSQLNFFNAPTSSTFEPNVEKYWESYIAGGQNLTASSTMSNMAIWMNIFPLQFSTPLNVFSSTFAANVTTPALSASEKNSQSLTRDVKSRFGLNEIQAYTADKGSLATSSGSEIPGKDAKGQTISQGIISLFSV